ncbi:MAG: hypothetical protein M0R80_07805 [Proteobacteria bacterium]|jgi:hypothetical protein|nr:hypothetical protein [Pseudomonadota bacterium]
MEFKAIPTNKKDHPIERMLIAVPDFSGKAIIMSYQGVGIECDIEGVGSNTLDDLGIDHPEIAGLWIWEGIPVWRYRQSYYGEDDGEMDYSSGEWREPTLDELEKIQKGESIWPFTFFCMECGHEQFNQEPCENCDSVKIISVEIIEQHFGKGWRNEIA